MTLAGHQAEQAHVSAEINTIRAVAALVGLGDDIPRAVNILAGILAVMWDPFAILLLVSAASASQSTTVQVQTKVEPVRTVPELVQERTASVAKPRRKPGARKTAVRKPKKPATPRLVAVNDNPAA